jgi:hypothetical protein
MIITDAAMTRIRRSNSRIKKIKIRKMDPSCQSVGPKHEPFLECRTLDLDNEVKNDRSEIEEAGVDPDDSSQNEQLGTDDLSRRIAGEGSEEDDDADDLDGSYDADGWPKIKIYEKGLYEWGFKRTTFGNFGNHEGEEGVARFRELLSLFDLEEAPLEVSSFGSIKFIWCSCKDNRYLKLVSSDNPITGQCGDFLKHMKLSKIYPGDFPTVLSRGYLAYVGVESDSAEFLLEFTDKYRELSASIAEESSGNSYII